MVLALVHVLTIGPAAMPGVSVAATSGGQGLNLRLLDRVETLLRDAGISARRMVLDDLSITVRLPDADTQDRAMALLSGRLGLPVTRVDAVSAFLP